MPNSNASRLTLSQRRRLERLQHDLRYWQQQGIVSLAKLDAFVELAQSEGQSLRDVAGPAGSKRYNLLLQSLLDLGPGRAAKRRIQQGAGLVTTQPSKDDGRSRVVRLTAKGKRLRERLLAR